MSNMSKDRNTAEPHEFLERRDVSSGESPNVSAFVDITKIQTLGTEATQNFTPHPHAVFVVFKWVYFKIPCNILQWNIIHAMWTWSPNDVSSIAASPLKRTKLKGMVGVLQYIYTKWFLAVEVSFVYICNFISKAPSETLDTIIHWFKYTNLFESEPYKSLPLHVSQVLRNIKRSTTSKIGKAIHGIRTLSMLSSSHGSTFKANTLTSFNCQAIIFSTFILEDQSDCFIKTGRLMIRQEYLLI